MTPQEILVLERSAELYNEFVLLLKETDGSAPNDLDDFVFHLHSLQRIVMARGMRREYPDFFNIT
jgi:hypothetical protein